MVEIDIFVREKKAGSFAGVLHGFSDSIRPIQENTDIIAQKWLSVSADARGITLEIWVDDKLVKTIDLDEIGE